MALKLSAPVIPMEVIQFMETFTSETYPNPFNPHERIWRMKVRFTISPHQDYIWISAVESIEPRRGYGTEAMQWLMGLAQDYGVVLQGSVTPFGPKAMREELLADWYLRLGFSINHHELYFNGENQ